MNSLAPVLVCILIVITFGAILLTVARWFSAQAKGPAPLSKSLPYECGLKEEERKSTRLPIHFYLTAILFILFDIEIIFLYPWALSFRDFLEQGQTEALLAMLVFLIIFIYGLVWEIFSKALHWK